MLSSMQQHKVKALTPESTRRILGSEPPVSVEHIQVDPLSLSAMAVIMGRAGGLKGGPARALALSAKRRSEISKMAADKRWGRR
jgi:hypothetical protein